MPARPTRALQPKASPLPSPHPAAARLRRWWPRPATIAIILGSGFDAVRHHLDEVRRLACRQLPGFPVPRVAGHAGEVIWGRLGSVPVLLLAGRSHVYEGWSPQQVAFPVRVLARLGIQTLLLTNAAGGIHRRFPPGTFMLLKDHINAMGSNPLIGPVPRGQERFVDLSQTYSPRLRRQLRQAARKIHLPLREGVYIAVTGPSYETPAEIRAFARLGADAIGMSSVPEAIVARQCGLEVAGLSCITNPAAGLHPGRLSHHEVLETAGHAGKQAGRLLATFLEAYHEPPTTTPTRPGRH